MVVIHRHPGGFPRRLPVREMPHGRADGSRLLNGRGIHLQQRPIVADERQNRRIFVPILGSGVPSPAQRWAEQSPRLQLAGQIGGGELGVAGGKGGDRGGGEGLEAERLANLPPVAIKQPDPGLVAGPRMDHQVARLAAQVGEGFLQDLGRAGGVATPVKAASSPQPLVAAAAPEARLAGAQFEHRDLVGVHVGQQPLIGVQAITAVGQQFDRAVNRRGVLDRLPDA